MEDTNNIELSDFQCNKVLHNMELNTNKAGMEGLDIEKINEIIENASVGSKFYEHKKQCQRRIDERISQMKLTLTKLTEDQIRKAEKEMDKLCSDLERERDLSRTIVHIDMDMFYAAVEMRDDPSLKDKPMAVGGNSMLSTSNYAARKFGVRAAMPGFIAKKLCPSLVIVPCNFDKYRKVSVEIQGIFEKYDPNFCPMSLDEAYLDITDYLQHNSGKYESRSGESTAELVVAEIRDRICDVTALTASAGIAPNTRLAKVCSDMNKPNGQFYLPSDLDRIREFVKSLSIRKISGIGNVSEQQLKALDVCVCSDLFANRGILRLLFSENSCNYFMRIALGLGTTEVAPSTERERKSISNETTFSSTSDKEELCGIIHQLSRDVRQDMARKDLTGKVLTLKMKTNTFQVRTRAQTLFDYTRDETVMYNVAKKILINESESEIAKTGQPLTLRLLGVRMSNFQQENNDDGNIKQATLTQILSKKTREISDRNPHDTQFSRKILTSDNNEPVYDTENLINSVYNVNISDNPTYDHENSVENTNNIDEYLDDFKFKQESRSDDNYSYINENDIHKNLTCPVCFRTAFSDIESLNKHLDSCLSSSVVKELVRETHTASSSKQDSNYASDKSIFNSSTFIKSSNEEKKNKLLNKSKIDSKEKRKVKSTNTSARKRVKCSKTTPTNTLHNYLISE